MQVERDAVVKEGLRQLELAALPSGREWKMWWNERSRFVEMTYAWERALVDAIAKLIHNQYILAWYVRMEGDAKQAMKYDTEGHVYGDSRPPDEITREALVWFLNVIKPAEKNAPEWAQILFRGVEGAYIQQTRLGLELAGIKRKGYLTLNHSATAPNPQAFDERFTETL